ncbi:hypothetical protein BKA81DRAFT_417095 [Phyllosticta paracitricarpa]|uniref:Uncharacterized protein n=1 Tax=Phyllosticta citricarpa TaxID=55181 RepID=A0ABR1M5P3_9PEZI
MAFVTTRLWGLINSEYQGKASYSRMAKAETFYGRNHGPSSEPAVIQVSGPDIRMSSGQMGFVAKDPTQAFSIRPSCCRKPSVTDTDQCDEAQTNGLEGGRCFHASFLSFRSTSSGTGGWIESFVATGHHSSTCSPAVRAETKSRGRNGWIKVPRVCSYPWPTQAASAPRAYFGIDDQVQLGTRTSFPTLSRVHRKPLKTG